MMDGINNIFKRMNEIQNSTRSLNNMKPEFVKEFEEMYNEAVSKNTDTSKTKTSKTGKSDKTEVHPYLDEIKDEVNISAKNLAQYKGEYKSQIDQAVTDASSKYKISEDLIRAIIQVESNYDPKAVSKAGAMGLMQIIPKTSLELGLEKPFDINENIDAGTKYLKQLLGKYNGDLEKSLAAYNAGPQSVDKYNGIPDFTETKNYVKNIMQILFKQEE